MPLPPSVCLHRRHFWEGKGRIGRPRQNPLFVRHPWRRRAEGILIFQISRPRQQDGKEEQAGFHVLQQVQYTVLIISSLNMSEKTHPQCRRIFSRWMSSKGKTRSRRHRQEDDHHNDGEEESENKASHRKKHKKKRRRKHREN